jgi:hypothetical protein
MRASVDPNTAGAGASITAYYYHQFYSNLDSKISMAEAMAKAFAPGNISLSLDLGICFYLICVLAGMSGLLSLGYAYVLCGGRKGQSGPSYYRVNSDDDDKLLPA